MNLKLLPQPGATVDYRYPYVLFPVRGISVFIFSAGRIDLLCITPGTWESRGAEGSASHRSPAQPACRLGHFSSVGGNSLSAFGVHVAQGMKRDSGFFLVAPLAEHKASAGIPGLPTLKPRQLQLFIGVLPRNS